MTKRLFQSHLEKGKKELWLSGLDRADQIVFYLILLFLPTQLGRHYWPDFSYILGIRIDYLSPTLYFTDLLIFTLFLIVVVKKEIPLKPNIYYSFFLCLLFFSAILSKNIEVSLIAVLRFIEFSFLAYYVFKKVRINSLFLKIISLGILFESVLSLIQFLNKESIQGIFYFLGERAYSSQTPNIANTAINGELILRPYGTFSHPNVLAGFLLIGVSFVLLFAKPKIKIEKIFFSSAVVTGSLGIILTMGRSAIAGLFILYLFQVIQILRSRSVRRLTPIILVVSVMVIFLFSFSNRFFNFTLNDESVVRREELINSSIEMISDYPILGVGPNNYLTNLPDYYFGTKQIFYIQPVHNIYLLFLSQAGVIAGALALLFLARLFIRTILKMKLILFLAFFLGFFDHYFLTQQQTQILLTILIGLSFAYTKSGKDLIK